MPLDFPSSPDEGDIVVYDTFKWIADANGRWRRHAVPAGPDLTNLLIWLKNGDASGSTWTDSSGNGYDLTLYNSPTINGSGSVTFNGTDEHGEVTYSAGRGYARYIRCKILTWTVDKVLTDDSFALSNHGLFLYSASPNITFRRAGNGIPYATNSEALVGSYFSIAYGLDGANLYTQVGETGTRFTATAPATGPYGYPRGISIAAGHTIPGGAIGTHLNVEIVEVLDYSVEHDAAKNATILAYLDTLL